MSTFQGSSLLQTTIRIGGGVALAQVALVGVIWSQVETSSTLVGPALGVCAGLSIVGWGAQSALLKSKIMQPLVDAIKGLKALSKGHLKPAIPTGQAGEVGALCKSIVELSEFMTQLQSQLDSASLQLDKSSESLQNGTKGISHHVQETHSMADQIAAAMDEMTMTAREVSGHASQAADQTHAMNESVNHGQKSMNDAINAIGRLATQMDVAVDTVQKLAEDSSSVGKVLSVIRGIAEQTNLLALNAAIEAARAGEQGRGFAVVADEVRSLAQKTQESTQEIQVIIENVQNGAKNATSVMDSSKSITTETSGLFSEAGSKLQEIGESIAQLSSLNTHVARAVDEQTKAADSIGRDVTRIAQIAEEFKSLQADVQITSGELSKLAISNSKLCTRFQSTL